MTVNEVDFKEAEEDAEPKPLGMEHFYFPLGVWLVGNILAVLCFPTEIIFYRLTKSKSEEPNV